MFALDSSTSVSKANFLEVRKFVANVTSFFTIGKNDIHVAVIKYSTTALVEVDLTQFMDKGIIPQFRLLEKKIVRTETDMARIDWLLFIYKY